MKIKPTKEQNRIWDFPKKRSENLIINALAGSGKTFTLIKLADKLPKTSTKLFLAFNRHIKEELGEKLPKGVKCYTTYGLGLSAIKRKYGNKCEFDPNKLDKIIKKESKKWKLDIRFIGEKEKFDYLNKIKKLVDLCRATLTLNKEFIKPLAKKHNLFELANNDDIAIVVRLLKLMIDTKPKTYDFLDMIYLPAVENMWFYQYDYVLVDEIQDINKCQLNIIFQSLKKDKINKKKYKGKIIGVGDKHQTIYSFNGVDEKSFERFQKIPNTKTLPLTVSFRCSKAVIREAQKVVPDIKARDDAPEGSVINGNVMDAVEGDFVLCRTTAPLIQLFFDFLNIQKKATIKGSDIGIKLLELTNKFKCLNEMNSYWDEKLQEFKSQLLKEGVLNPKENGGYVEMEDKVKTIRFLSNKVCDIDGLKCMIKDIFKDETTGIVLSTVHKVKGLETDNVYIIKPELLPMEVKQDWEKTQERNLQYVAITRAKKNLIYDENW